MLTSVKRPREVKEVLTTVAVPSDCMTVSNSLSLGVRSSNSSTAVDPSLIVKLYVPNGGRSEIGAG